MIKSERIGARVTVETKKKLDEICKRENRSISNVVGIAIERYLQENKLSEVDPTNELVHK